MAKAPASSGGFCFCRNDSLGPSILTVLFQQTIRPSHCVSNPGTFGLSSLHPIFFRWRKRQPKQISRTGDYASSHVHPKHGATRKAWRLKSRVWQPSLNSRADSLRCGVLLDITLDLSRNLGLQQLFHESERYVDHALCAHGFRRLFHDRPIQRRSARSHGGYVCHPHEPLPEMLCAVNANQNKFILRGKRRDTISVERDGRASRKIVFHRERLGKVTEGVLCVKLNKQPRSWLHEKILAGN